MELGESRTTKSVNHRGLVRVAVIASLCLLAGLILYPSYLEPTSASPGSRARADLRALATGLESYFVDEGADPVAVPVADFVRGDADKARVSAWNLTMAHSGSSGLYGLTTPVAYLTQQFVDPFSPGRRWPFAYFAATALKQGETGPEAVHGWIAYSMGPDGDYDIVEPGGAMTQRHRHRRRR